MYIPTQFKIIQVASIVLSLSISGLAMGQTFSPYTPAQIQEFNSQPIAPIQTPEGPVYLENRPTQQQPRSSLDSRYLKNPDGEEQAEALGDESAAPFQPMPTTITF